MNPFHVPDSATSAREEVAAEPTACPTATTYRAAPVLAPVRPIAAGGGEFNRLRFLLLFTIFALI